MLALLWLWMLGLAPATAHGAPSPADDPPTVRVAASQRYKAGRLHSFTAGGGYRDLWEQEIELPLLELEETAGGLTPTGRHGGLQSAVLAFKGADGKSYTFRGTDKDPSAVLDPVLRNTIIQSFVQDQMAAQHPAGPVAAGILTEAAGVLSARPIMVVLPDDPALGEYRAEFAGMVGVFFEYPQPGSDERPGFHGATEIIGYRDLYARLAEGRDDEIDTKAFLRARLIDLFLGDFDRHRKQWRWAKIPGKAGWQPIPEDRDQAFVRFSGLGPAVGRLYIPILQKYSARYPAMKGLALHGWEQDRWLLAHLSWDQWVPIIADLQARLDDATIDRALAALPPEYLALDEGKLRGHIIGRRDNLAKGARRFYEHLAREVDVQTSDASDRLTVTRAGDGLRIRVESTDSTPRVSFDRTFYPRETHEVRVYLRGGDDHVQVDGRSRPIRLRVIAGEGHKTLDDREGGGTRIYDADGNVAVARGRGTRVDHNAYELPASDAGFVDVDDVPPRDWRSETAPFPEVEYLPDVGLYLGAKVTHTRYAFRKHPWASKHSFSGGWAFEAAAPRLHYNALLSARNTKVLGEVDVFYSGIEVMRFYGFGNETASLRADRLFRVRNEQARLSPSLRSKILDDRVRISVGPFVQVSRTRGEDRLLHRIDPYGTGVFGNVGMQAGVQLDTRRTLATGLEHLVLPFNPNPAAGYPTSGFLIDLSGRVSPPLWDATEVYGSVKGSAALFGDIAKQGRATVAVRIGGERNFGRTPYFDAATLGGGRTFKGTTTNRGFAPQRFTGDTSVYSNSDLRVFLARVKLVVPGDFGVQGFGDAGRVLLRGEQSNVWHFSGGGGVWFSPLVRANTISASLARSNEGTFAYLRLGFHY